MLKFDITHKDNNVVLSGPDKEKLHSTLSWLTTPNFPHRGRMAWQRLLSPIQLKVGNRIIEYRSIKIKGVGAFNPPSDAKFRDPIYEKVLDKPVKPTNKPLTSFVSYPHFGFTDQGKFKVAFGDVAPIGGIIHRKAVKEFVNASHLVENGVPTIYPLLVIKYRDYLDFKSEELGVVCSLSPMEHPFRLSELQAGIAIKGDETGDKYEFFKNVLKVEGISNSNRPNYECLNKVAFKVGSLMNAFSKSGLYRYSAELPNFEYDLKNAIPVITDLDSSEFLNELNPIKKELEVLRDLCSMTYHFTAKFATPNALGLYSLEKLVKSNPLKSLLHGYFDGNFEAEIESISMKFWKLFIPHFIQLNKNKDKIVGEWSVERRRSYKMDHHFFYVYSMILFYDVFKSSELGVKFKSNELSKSILIENAKLYMNEDDFYFLNLIL